jgi:hypothetical protein
MADISKAYTMITDFVTDRQVPNVGAEENRQVVEKLLVEQKGYLKEDIKVDVDIAITVAGEPYNSQVDLVVSYLDHVDGGTEQKDTDSKKLSDFLSINSPSTNIRDKLSCRANIHKYCLILVCSSLIYDTGKLVSGF